VENISRSIKVTKQSFNNLSLILFLTLFFTKHKAENTLSTLAVATGKIKTLIYDLATDKALTRQPTTQLVPK
jgi:hypothetical protein